MILQLEDCLDVLKTLYPQYDLLFLFDHSCGHDKQQPNGLNAENMSKNYGGQQSILRPTIIKQVDGYLGPYRRTLNVGSIQNFVFQDDDDGPFWMNEQERAEKKEDKVLEGQTRKRKFTKAELVQKLRERNILVTGTYQKIKECCDENQIQTYENLAKIVPGWNGKQKGLLQSLWERGWINEASLTNYTIDGKTDLLGVRQMGTSLKYLMANCTDFIEEESLLQSMGRQMGATIDRTPKCHPELAGEGIEYSWACSKNKYRLLPLGERRSRDRFKECVRTCLSPDILTKELIRKNSRRAREYMCAYHVFHQQQQQAAQASNTQQQEVAIPTMIESLVKKFKTHRCALDFDHGFVKAAIKEEEEHREK